MFLGDEMMGMRSERNLVQSREFSEMLKKTLNAYHNRAIATPEVIDELIKLAKQLSEADKRGVDLGLNDDEVALTPSFPLGQASPSAFALSVSLASQRLGSTTRWQRTTAPYKSWAKTTSK